MQAHIYCHVNTEGSWAIYCVAITQRIILRNLPMAPVPGVAYISGPTEPLRQFSGERNPAHHAPVTMERLWMHMFGVDIGALVGH